MLAVIGDASEAEGGTGDGDSGGDDASGRASRSRPSRPRRARARADLGGGRRQDGGGRAGGRAGTAASSAKPVTADRWRVRWRSGQRHRGDPAGPGRERHRGHGQPLAQAGRRPGRGRRAAAGGLHRQGRHRDPVPDRRHVLEIRVQRTRPSRSAPCWPSSARPGGRPRRPSPSQQTRGRSRSPNRSQSAEPAPERQRRARPQPSPAQGRSAAEAARPDAAQACHGDRPGESATGEAPAT